MTGTTWTPPHTITVVPERAFDNGSTWYRAVCSCGKYRSRRYAIAGHAGNVGDAHTRDKNREAQR